MQDFSIANSFATLLQGFAGCFTAPSASSFVTLMTGWVLFDKSWALPILFRLHRSEKALQALVPTQGGRHLQRYARDLAARFLAPKTS